MTLNQAFKILTNVAGAHVARIIVDAMPRMSRWRLFWIVRKLRAGVPVAKIVHYKWFYGLKFYTSKWTLDPRPDTETIVDAVLGDYKKAKHISIADLGCGTGCIICAIAKNISAHGVGLEKSWAAARVAQKNIRDLGLMAKISVQHGDFGCATALPAGVFDVIVSNPPYIARGDARVDLGAMHDPKMALFAAHNGLAAYEMIAKNAQNWLKSGGRIYLEIGIDMDADVIKIFEDAGWIFVKSVKDLGEVVRVLVFENIK